MSEDVANQSRINKAADLCGLSLEEGHKKKPTELRPWLLLNSAGQAQLLEVGKHAVMRRTGLPGRDLRILDPLLSYPSTLLGREHAIVINLEHIKAIITAQEVLLLNSRHPYVAPFADELQRRIFRSYNATKSQEAGANSDDVYWSNMYDLEETPSMGLGLKKGHDSFPAKSKESMLDLKKQNSEARNGLLLPFEFVALEACLKAACNCLDSEARTLEQEAQPALDRLTTKISALNLERVRQLKSRLSALIGRVHKVRDEMEQLLDDDEDMAEMYLTVKLLQQLENSSVSSNNEQSGLDDEAAYTTMDDNQISADLSVEGNAGSVNYDVGLHPERLFAGSQIPSKGSRRNNSSTRHSSLPEKLNVEDLEMLLEAYFVHIDGTFNKLSTLKEYVDDTEDYINIMLDDRQNQLLQMGVILTTATLVLSVFIVLVGILGINIHIDLFDHDTTTNTEFLWATCSGTIGIIVLYLIAIACYKHKRVIQ